MLFVVSAPSVSHLFIKLFVWVVENVTRLFNGLINGVNEITVGLVCTIDGVQTSWVFRGTFHG